MTDNNRNMTDNNKDMTDSNSPRQRLLVIGAGFAGLNLVKKLDLDKYQVTVVDSNNYHSFPPLFYQLASAGLDAASINFPLRRELRKLKKTGGRYRLGTVQSIDCRRKKVRTQFEELEYDILVIAAGTTNNFFGNTGRREHVYTLKSASEALRCRNAVLERLERASVSSDPHERRRLLTFVVIGGVVYYLVVVLVLWLRLNSNDLKLITAVIVALFLAVPYLREQRKTSFKRLRAKEDSHA